MNAAQYTAREILLKHWNGALPVDLDKLSKDLGVVVQYDKTLSDAVSGSFEYINEQPTITINAHQHPTRQRFTLAHELGHYILGHSASKDGSEIFFRAEGQRNPLETAANHFAAELLMPKAIVDKIVLENDIKSINSLGELFGVSGKAMTVRLHTLGWFD